MFSPDRQGFFPALWLQFLQNLPPTDRARWKTLTTSKERLEWICENSFMMSRLELLQSMRSEKDLTGSLAKREAGNEAWKAGDFATALVNYSRAVVLAPDDSQDLALAFANRAACLQKMGGYEFAIKDIKIALESKYPEENRFKLEERRAQCLLALRRYKEARVAVEAALTAVKRSRLEKQRLNKFLSDCQETLNKIEKEEKDGKKDLSTAVSKSTVDAVKEEILKVEHPGPIYKAACDAVNIKYQKGRGRYAVAVKDISVGTTLLVEQPVTWALHPERFGSHCQNCFGQVKAVIPCRICCGVSFCSQDCREHASTTYHRYECGLLNVLVASGLNVYPFLVIRLLARYGFEKLWSYKDELNYDNSSGSENNRKDVYDSEDFVNAYNLVCHEADLDNEERMLRCLVAVFLFKLLKFNNFFPNSDGQDNLKENQLSEKELYICELILHFLYSIPQNVHDIALMETSDSGKWLNSNKIKSLGAGVYLTAALYNHSCDPSFMRCNFGTGIVTVANRNIKIGEEISECYGQMYYTKSSEQRKNELRGHYRFECCCIACAENWPTVKDMSYAQQGQGTQHQHLARIRCCSCGQVLERLKGMKISSVLTCLRCGTETKVEDVPVDEILELSRRAERILNIQGKWTEGIQVVKECQEKFDKYLVPPSMELYTTQISIWRALWTNVGNKKLVKDF